MPSKRRIPKDNDDDPPPPPSGTEYRPGDTMIAQNFTMSYDKLQSYITGIIKNQSKIAC